MRRIFTFVIAVGTAAALVAGCGSDDDSGPANNAGAANHAGAGGGSSNPACVGYNAEFTQSEYLAHSTPGKACANESDNAKLCANDLTTITFMCGRSCLAQGGDDEAQAKCVATCITQNLVTPSQPIGSDCVACYTADVECARKHCLGTCGANPASVACATCRSDNGCTPAFYDCSGVPMPGAENGAAGSANDAASGAGGA